LSGDSLDNDRSSTAMGLRLGHAVGFAAVTSRPAVLLLLALLLVAAPAALGGSTRAVANSQTFNDSIGEDASAPDITSVVVSNDDAGLITFQVNVSNRPAFTQDMYFLIFIDSDNNAATGNTDSLGAEYAIDLEAGAVGLFHWNGTTYEPASAQTSLTYAYASTGPTIRVAASELGKTKAIRFGTVASSGFAVDASGNPITTNEHRDFAPDLGHGLFSYQVLTKLVLTVTAFTTSPKPAKAGRTFSVSLAATENDTGGPVQSGTVSCAASLAGKRVVAVRHVVANGVATCVYRIPRTAKGRSIRGRITLTVQGTQVTRPFSAKFS
jgi:hypothetical protein